MTLNWVTVGDSQEAGIEDDGLDCVFMSSGDCVAKHRYEERRVASKLEHRWCAWSCAFCVRMGLSWFHVWTDSWTHPSGQTATLNFRNRWGHVDCESEAQLSICFAVVLCKSL